MAGERALSNRLAVGGAAGCILALVLLALLPAPAWRAWLAAGFACTAAPIGAIGLLMMMRLMPGDWSEELGPPLETAALLLPLAALVILPVLVEMQNLYAWTRAPGPTAFQKAYLSEPLFVARTVVWFGLLFALGARLVARRPAPPAVACVGLVLFAIVGTLAAVDWLLSLDAGFSSSGFGLYVLCIQMMTALALAIALLVLSGRTLRRPGILGGLMLCLLLMWSYLAFMHFFITWSDNLPPGVRWYQRRSVHGWDWVMGVVAATRLGPTVLLLFASVRRSARALLTLTLLIAAGTVLEAAWLALPAPSNGPGLAGLAVFALATASIGSLMAGAIPRAAAWRERRRGA
jgi:hypothetical protein